MKEQDWLEKIRQSAQDVEIPDSLKPDKIEEMLKQRKRGGKRKKAIVMSGVSAAAAAVILLGSYTAFQIMDRKDYSYDIQEQQAAQVELGAAEEENAVQGNEAASYDMEESYDEPRKDAGDLYVVAENYQQVYDVLEQQLLRQNMMKDELAMPGMPVEEEYNDIQKEISQEISPEMSSDTTDGIYISSESQSPQQETSSKLSYSTTNLQTQGVDESDIIKTDGSYIYTVTGNRVVITDIRNGNLDIMETIELPAEGAGETIVEMYVAGGRLILITEGQKTDMEQRSEEDKEEGDGDAAQDMSRSYYVISSENITSVYTYDIKSPGEPRLLGKGTQEGSYNTSRKIGDMIYLFTQEMPEITDINNSAEKDDWKWIPLVNEKRIASDCIYIPEQGGSALIVSSLYVDRPGEQADNIMIVNDSSNVYVSQNAIYLYETDYGNNTTRIAKFSLGKKLNAVGAVSVKGKVTDTFAVNDYQGNLRILTTCTDSERISGSLYLLDQELNITGSLEGIAPGETIYAARYLGNTAYFVTYRNMDPLFAVDLSDVHKPKILGELKITGYSDYLHFWDKNKLLGIGYETDADTGAVKGVKMAMFDISDPSDMKVMDTCIIENTSYTPAVSQYKAALVDTQENLIGYAVSGYEKGTRKDNYVLFEWKDGRFHSLLTKPLSTDFMTGEYRGLYAGNVFYLASPGGITSFDREDDYRMLKSLDLTVK